MRELREILNDIDAEAKTKPGYGTHRAMRYIESKYYLELRDVLRASTAYVKVEPQVLQSYTIGESSKGRTEDFESSYGGSNPSSPTTILKADCPDYLTKHSVAWPYCDTCSVDDYSEKGPFQCQ